jgi:hypothetical protein
MPPADFEHATPASERAQTYALDCAATTYYVIKLDPKGRKYPRHKKLYLLRKLFQE